MPSSTLSQKNQFASNWQATTFGPPRTGGGNFGKLMTRFKDIAGFDDKYLVLAGIPLVSALSLLIQFSEEFKEANWKILGPSIPIALFYVGMFWLGFRWVYAHTAARFSGSGEAVKRVAIMIVLFMTTYVIIDKFLLTPLIQIRYEWWHAETGVFTRYRVAGFIVALLALTMYETLFFRARTQKLEGEKAQLARQHVESQLEGLRNQVNPHFLFNSLNTLTWLIADDSEKAVRFVRQLSKVYRYVLESREARIILLSEELDFMKSYVFLLNERFGNNLKVEMNGLEAYSHLAIVPLSLQMLFENAIKHNVLSAQKPLTIEVFIQINPAGDPMLVMRNNLQHKKQVMESTGVGLENIRERYRILTGREVEVIVSSQYFTVALPLLTLENV
jgi:two-component system LytT family sensor kinase